jgi:hypothetical protein
MDNYISTLKANGGNSIDILIDAGAPSGSDAGFSSSALWASTVIVPGHTYWQLLVALSSKLHAQGMFMLWQPTYSNVAGFVSLLSSPTLTSSYCSQYATIVRTINPDVCNIFSEPGNANNDDPVSFSYMSTYVSFCVSVANALVSANSNVKLGVMGCPWWDGNSVFYGGNSYFTAGQSIFDSLPLGTMFLTHVEYDQSGNTNNFSPWIDYWNGNLAKAKTSAYSILLEQYGVQNCENKGIPVLFEALGTLQGNPNALQWLEDATGFCNIYSVSWMTSGSIPGNPCTPWAWSSPTSLNSYGQTMFSNIIR